MDCNRCEYCETTGGLEKVKTYYIQHEGLFNQFNTICNNCHLEAIKTEADDILDSNYNKTKKEIKYCHSVGTKIEDEVLYYKRNLQEASEYHIKYMIKYQKLLLELSKCKDSITDIICSLAMNEQRMNIQLELMNDCSKIVEENNKIESDKVKSDKIKSDLSSRFDSTKCKIPENIKLVD